MKFININERKPKQGQIVLIKTKEGWLPYYVCRYYEHYLDKASYFEEAGGENYATWEEDEIQGWTPIEDIEKPEASCKDCMFSLRDYRGFPTICNNLDRSITFEGNSDYPMAICSFYKEVKHGGA